MTKQGMVLLTKAVYEQAIRDYLNGKTAYISTQDLLSAEWFLESKETIYADIVSLIGEAARDNGSYISNILRKI
jgi:hypothetical protein